MNKKILGLDLGANSIGWALVEQNFEERTGKILGAGSRIIPMSQDILGEFGRGNSISQTAERSGYRGVRRLRERHLLRRERLHRVLNILGFLPEHYQSQIDFTHKTGKFLPETEPKLAYKNNAFIFQSSFGEMIEDFRKSQPDLVSNNKKIPFDWTIYYLRKKALDHKIEKEELAWILLNFNQKRGYYQLRGEEEEENPNKIVEFYSLKVIDVFSESPQKGKTDIWYSLILENGWIYRRSSKIPLYDWKDKTKDFIVTTDLNDDGTVKTNKEGEDKRSFRAPGDDDWTLLKKKTEQIIDQSKKTVGTYIYDTLLKNPNQKIRGKLVRTIERKYYKDELKQILQQQIKYHPELQNSSLYKKCINELYRNNKDHRFALSHKGFLHLFIDDIIFYQRPLRSQKSTISNCPLEFRKYWDNEETRIQFVKAIPKSNPYYQEFRLWRWIHNLNLYHREDEKNITKQIISTVEEFEKLFEFLNNLKEIDQSILLKFFKLNVKTHRWNYVEDKKYPCNETRALISSRLKKVTDIPMHFLSPVLERQLWHIIYSVTDKNEFERALKTFALKNHINVEEFKDNFIKIPPYKSDYGAYSEKAIKKLLPLMRMGKYWNWDSIDEKTKYRIDKILNAEFDESIKERVREKAIRLTNRNEFQGLPEWLAKYIVYDRHSEGVSADKWNSASDIETYLQEFRQHSLRNPIVEQVFTETLRVVRDIWVKYGRGSGDFITEIHVELGRDMKNPAGERKKITEQITKNENTNLRIKALLAELYNDVSIENVRPYSPVQQEILKIYEDGVINSEVDIPDDIEKISKTAQPSSSELTRYKLWLEQKYRSPYTGRIIPLSKLFTHEYEIEHIIPQSRYFDDSLSNKIICESAVNKEKGNQLGLEFILNNGGRIIELGQGKSVTIFTEQAYQSFVKENYGKNRAKQNKLLMVDLPVKMIERQLNDTRYISKFVTSVLSNIVRSTNNDDGINSKNVIPCTGKITSQLKQDWGLNDIWNDLILPRFERMNEITNSSDFTTYNEKYQKHLPTVPLELSKGFQKKRIDHRHHALDAIVIACATRNHINYMNNQHALEKSKSRSERQAKREDLRQILCDKQYDSNSLNNYTWIFKKPWDHFPADVRNSLETLIVSFKQNIRVINKSTNYFSKWIMNGDRLVKTKVKQSKGQNWAIRKSMLKDTVAGIVKLMKVKEVSLSNAIDNVKDIRDKEIKKRIIDQIKKGKTKKEIIQYIKELNSAEEIIPNRLEIFYWEIDQNGVGINTASRTSIDTSFTQKKIESITDSGIQKILLNHLKLYKGRKDDKGKVIEPATLAFTPEAIEEMNNNIVTLNNGKFHQPIYKVRTYEPKGNKFQVGNTGNKSSKFVEAAKGTNLFFAIYEDSSGKRSFETIPLNVVIERQKQGLSSVPEINEKGHRLLFNLSPNDHIYVDNISNLSYLKNKQSLNQIKNIYRVVSFTSSRLYALPISVALSIVDKQEFSLLNKMELTFNKISIKTNCIKLEVDRLGNIVKITTL